MMHTFLLSELYVHYLHHHGLF